MKILKKIIIENDYKITTKVNYDCILGLFIIINNEIICRITNGLSKWTNVKNKYKNQFNTIFELTGKFHYSMYNEYEPHENNSIIIYECNKYLRINNLIN